VKHLKIIRHLRFRYVLGLSAIAILVTASYISMQQVINKQRFHATLVNLAGHQSGLSNRIAYFAGLMASTEDDVEYNMARGQIGRTINKMRNAHKILTEGSVEDNIPFVTNNNLKTIYGDPMVGLNEALSDFLKRAEEIYNLEMADFSLNSSAYIFLTTYGPHVLEPLLDAAVDEYEIIGEEAILRIKKLEKIIWISTLIALCLEIAFIFVPLEGNVKQTLKSLEKSIAELTQTRKRLISAQKLALVGDWEYNRETDSMYFSDQIFDILGIPTPDEKFTWDSFLQYVHPDDCRQLEKLFSEIPKSEHSNKIEYRIIQDDFSERLVYQYATRKIDSNTGAELFTGTIQDITERKELSTRLEKLSEHVPGFIFQCHRRNDGTYKIHYASKGIEDTCGISLNHILKNSSSLLKTLHPDDTERFKLSMEESSQTLETWQAQFRINHPQKDTVWLEGHATPGKMVDGSVLWYGYVWDITERKESEDRINKLALYDPLTGLANRRLMRDKLTHALAVSRNNGSWGGLIMLDLDNFKTLNDTKGHELGDELLIEVSERLNKCVRGSDTTARLGGDEFVVILEDVGATMDEAKEYSLIIAEKIRMSLCKPYYLGEGQTIHHGSSSVGVTTFSGRIVDESTILKQADIAMYEAKETGRNRVCLYNEARLQEINQKSLLIMDLQDAIKNDELELYLQPQIDQHNRLAGAEALLRWFPADREPVSPAIFIPLAENSELIHPIGYWVIKEACRQLNMLIEKGAPKNFSLAVNISARQLNDASFLHNTKTIIENSGINPSLLRFEITESCLVEDFQHVNKTLAKLRSLGILIELDDFGTGYSSLNSLYQLHINALKIDKSLIKNIDSEDHSKEIIRAAIAMAKAMSVKVIAEGVENRAQKEFLRREKCDYQQGFYYSKPLPFHQFEALLTKRAAEHEVTFSIPSIAAVEVAA